MLLICTGKVKLPQRSRQHLVSGRWPSEENTCCTGKKIHVRFPRIRLKAELIDSTSNCNARVPVVRQEVKTGESCLGYVVENGEREPALNEIAREDLQGRLSSVFHMGAVT